MPSFEFTSPDGKKYTVDGPEGATQEQAFAILQKQLASPKNPETGKNGKELEEKPSDEDHYSNEEYESPADRQLTPEARRMEKLMRKQSLEKGGLGDLAKGVGEAGLSAVTGLAGSAAGGLRGLGSLISGEGVDEAARKVAATQKAMTYQPRSASGQVLNAAAGAVGQIPGKLGGAVGGEIGGAVDALQDGPQAYNNPTGKNRMRGEALGEVAPAILPAMGALGKIGAAEAAYQAAKPSINTRGAKLLQKAMEEDGFTKSDLDQAAAAVDKSYKSGTPITGPEALAVAPKLHKLLNDVDKSNPIISRFVRERPAEAKAAIQAQLDKAGDNVGAHEAANAAQEAATKVDMNAQKYRTEAAGPHYKAQEGSDAEALALMRQIKDTQGKVESGTKWRNDAVQQAGRWYQFSHEMGMKANEVATKVNEWASKDAEPEISSLENEGGKISDTDKIQDGIDKHGEYQARAAEGKSATIDAVKEAEWRRKYIDQWQGEVAAKSDQLAEKNLPLIQSKVSNFMSQLDKKIELAHPDTDSGKILTQFKNDLAPNGQPLMLPSQLESVYKANRDKLELGLQPTSMERTTAGVLKSHVKSLDSLIQQVSPQIKEGRDIYSQLSKEFIDPLKKGPIGQIAGKGADAQKESTLARVKAELEGPGATPDRIRTVFDQLGKVDPAASPNIVRSYLEQKFDKAQAEGLGQTDRLSGPKFAESIAKTPKERANIATMIEQTAKAQGASTLVARQAARGFSNLMESLQAQGRIPKLGVQGIEETSALGKVGDAALAGAHGRNYSAMKSLWDSMNQVWNKKAYKNLAQVFTDPKAIDKMVKLANLKPEQAALREQLSKEIIDGALMGATAAAVAPTPQQVQQ